MINPPEWGSGQGWEFPVKPSVVMGGGFFDPPFFIVFEQVLNDKQLTALTPVFAGMTDEERVLWGAKPQHMRCIYLWTKAGLPIAELVLDV